MMTLREVSYSFQDLSIKLYDTKITLKKLSYLTYFYVKSYVLDYDLWPFPVAMKMNVDDFVINKLKSFYGLDNARRFKIKDPIEMKRVYSIFEEYGLWTEEALLEEIRREPWYTKISHLKSTNGLYYHVSKFDIKNALESQSIPEEIVPLYFIDDDEYTY